MIHFSARDFSFRKCLRKHNPSELSWCWLKGTSNHTTQERSPASISEEARENTARVQSYYAETSDGYRDWSQKLNMHFGTYEWGINPFHLESMLENTNRLVLQSLQLQGENNHLLDLGCGLGGTMRFAAQLPAVQKITGVTIASNQIDEAKEISASHPQFSKLQFVNADYHDTGLANEAFDGAYAIESACHSAEPHKKSLLKEAYRQLKAGSQFTLCDGFIKTQQPMIPAVRYCYQKTCKHWALGNFPELNGTLATMKETGFQDIQVTDLSWQVLPSALYIPWMVTKYGAKLIYDRDTNPEHWNHLLAPAWGLALACSHSTFGYYMISGKKPQSD